MRSWVFALTCVVTASGTALTPTQSAPQVPTTRSAFASADAAARQQALAAIFREQLQVAPDELAAIVGLALADSDITTREAACSVVMATAARGRGQMTTEAKPYWQAAATALLTLNDQLVQVMRSDGEPRIRHSAVLALANLHMTVDSTAGVIRIPAGLAEALARAYGSESSDRVRAEIVKTVALSETESPRRQEIVTRALADPAPEVVQLAVMGIGRMKPPTGLPSVVDMLRHSEQRVRLAAAQAVAAYGAAARPYLPQLREALASERDEITRKTLEGTIGLIQKSKPPQTAQSSPPSQTLRARVDLIEVDVVVTDAKGRPVRGLQASDFRAYEDGKPVEISAFREVDASDAPLRQSAQDPAGQLAGNETPAGRLIVLVLDDWHIPFSPRVFNRMRDIAFRVIDGLRRDDRAAIVATSGRSSLQVDLTNDQTRLRGAVEAVSPLPPVASDPMGHVEKAWRGTSAIDVLKSLVSDLGTAGGRRKTVILVSGGVDFDLQGNPRDVASRNLQDEFMKLVQLAQRQNVVFYAFDPNVMEDLSTPGQTNLRVLADNTGGFANVNNNAFEPGVDRVLAEAGHHYFVGYVAPALDGLYHRIRVVTNRPGLTVRARHGYQSTRR